MSFGSATNKIGGRDWGRIRSLWRSSVEAYEDIGQAPQLGVQDVLDMRASSLETAESIESVSLSIAELRGAQFREAVFLGHKAGALLRSFDRDLRAAEPTYPEITAYTGSLFLAKAISLIFGVWVSGHPIGGYFWVLDVFDLEGAWQTQPASATQP
ncbi:hypothetical protein ABGV17_05235, partial [Guyparkeria sp. GHLCS8-2]|uniref:hypothetical protein n=1 Tax=Guyparkeria halopsychrophila TaxID=3139421 RepID=UPI0037CBF5B8